MLYTPQRLFGEIASSPNTLTHEPFLERARLQREQERDGSARRALGAYVVARLVDKLLVLENDEELLEGFRWQLEAVRRHVDELPGDAPETAHLAGVVAAVPAQGKPPCGLWKSLTAYAYFLEHEGRLEEALEMLALAARSQGAQTAPIDFTTYALFAARLNRQLARWDAASACYTAAGEVGATLGDAVSVLRGRLGCGAVNRGRGNLPLARVTAETVLQDATKLGLAEVQVVAYGDLGVVYGLLGLQLESIQAYYQAFRLSTDTPQGMRHLGDLAIGLLAIGAYEAARLAFEIVIKSNAGFLVRTNALLELMDLESAVENRVAFERCRTEVEAARDHLAPSMATDCQYKLGIGHARFGQIVRAREAFQSGLKLAEAHRLNAWYFKIKQALDQLSRPEERPPLEHAVSSRSQPPLVNQMVVGLREYADALTPA